MRTVRLVARREFVERGRDRSFLVSTLITIVVVVAVIVIPAVLSGSGTTYDVALSGPLSAGEQDRLQQLAAGTDVSLRLQTVDDVESARGLVSAKDVDAALVDGSAGPEIIARRSVPDKLQPLLDVAAREALGQQQLRNIGVDPAAVEQALDVPAPQLTLLDPASPHADTNRKIAVIGTLLLYGQLIGYGFWVALGVVEEKASRVVEVLLAAIRPRQLLTGKILGIGALGLVQLVGTAVAGVVAALVSDAVDLPSSAYGTIGHLLLWFLLGYAFYASAFAAGAALVSRQEDLQNVVAPFTMLNVVALLLGLQAASNPDSTLATICSFVPPLSVLVMPARYAGGGVGLWQVVVAMALMLAATLAVIRLAARLYEGGVLRFGARVRWREALRATR